MNENSNANTSDMNDYATIKKRVIKNHTNNNGDVKEQEDDTADFRQTTTQCEADVTT